MKKFRFSRKILGIPYAAFLFVFVAAPLAVLFYYAFTDGNGNPTFSNLVGFFANANTLGTLFYSFAVALVTTAVCLLIAYPTAYILANSRLKNRSALLLLFIMPMWINFSLRITALKEILTVIEGNLSFYPFLNAVVGMSYDFLPFMILPVYNAVTDLKDDVIEAARDLGAPPKAVLTRIMIPLTKPGIISGITMVFVPSLTAFAIPDILGGGKVMLIGNIIEQEFSTSMNWHLGSGLSIALMIFVLISMIFTSNEEEGKERRAW